MLDDLFEALQIWTKIGDGRLVEVEEGPRDPAKRCEGGESFYTRLRNASGLEVARIHYVTCPGQETERWPSALLFANVTVYRSGHQVRPPVTT